THKLSITQFDHITVLQMGALTSIITTVAGSGPTGTFGGFSGDGGPATSASLNRPAGVTVDGAGNIFIADSNNLRIRRVDAATGKIGRAAGSGRLYIIGDIGKATIE